MTRHELADAMIRGKSAQGVVESVDVYLNSYGSQSMCKACALGCAVIGKFDGDFLEAERIYDKLGAKSSYIYGAFTGLLEISTELAIEIEHKHLNGMPVQQIAAWLKTSEGGGAIMSDTKLVYGSLQDVAQREKKSVAETFLSVDALVMVDTSGSMGMNDCRNGQRRYDSATEQLIRLQRDQPGKLGIIAWNDFARFCPGGIPTSPCGGTDMAGVLRFVKPADNTSIKLILISDGEPDNESDALRLAGQFKSKIDCIFVGPESSPGREFLRKLAMATGGVSVSQSVQDIANLQQAVTKLLTA